MAKVVWKTTPKAAYEWVELEGGSTMSDVERKSMLDDYVEENGLVPVETTFVGESPVHKYGRYKAMAATASALPPALPSHSQGDVVKLNAEKASLEQQVARLQAQLGSKVAKSGADVVEGDGENDLRNLIPTSGGGATTEEMRENLNTQEGVNLVGGSEEVREDMSTADRSDDNPVVKRGRPKKGD